MGLNFFIVGLLAACGGDRPTALVAADRSEHLFARPFPSDELRGADGAPVLSGYPTGPSDLAYTLVSGWAAQASLAARGFSALSPVYLRFDGDPGLPESLPGAEDDPVRLVSLDSGHRPELQLRWWEDDLGDPYLLPGTLAVRPAPWTPLRGGERYALVVDREVARPALDWEPPAEVADEKPAVATVFTVQPTLSDLIALREAADAALDADPSLLQPTSLKRLKRLVYRQDRTPSGKAATACVVTFDDDSEEVSYLSAREGAPEVVVDLEGDRMEVWQATIQTVQFRDLEGQPWASPGIGLLNDFARREGGWIPFDADGRPSWPATPEPLRVVIQVPREGAGLAVATWDHGTGGSAYNAVQRSNNVEDFSVIRGQFADAGVVVVSRDQPLYGTRYPLIDAGFSSSLGFYNIGNLPAFRDNHRQAAVDHRVTHRFAVEVLPTLFESGRVAPRHVGAFGHSLGSVTAHLGLAAQQGAGADTVLMSGTGGYFAYFVADTGLLGSGNDIVGLLGPLLDVDLPEDPSGSEAVGALAGVPEAGWERVDGFHPVLALFQLIMDPGDPMTVVNDQPVPETIFMGVGDFQVPNQTTEWLVQGLPEATLVQGEARGEYDPHHVTFREPEGLQALDAFATEVGR